MRNQNKSFQRRSWFDTKQCSICKKQGTTFRYINSRHQYIICDNKHCDLMIRVKSGLFGTLSNKGEQHGRK